MTSENTRPPPVTVEDLAKLIDHSLLRPELPDAQVLEGCRVAREYNVATVTVRPCDVDTAVRAMEGSGIGVSTVAGFPHGSSTTATKIYEVRDLLRRGASEVDMVLQVIQYRRYPQPMTIRAKQMIEKVGGNFVGIVLNNINMSQDEGYYYYSGYYHDYYYSRNPDEQEAETKAAPAAGDAEIKQKY